MYQTRHAPQLSKIAGSLRQPPARHPPSQRTFPAGRRRPESNPFSKRANICADHARALNASDAATHCTGRGELAPPTAVAVDAQAKYSQRFPAAYGNRRSPPGTLCRSSSAKSPDPRIVPTLDSETSVTVTSRMKRIPPAIHRTPVRTPTFYPPPITCRRATGLCTVEIPQHDHSQCAPDLSDQQRIHRTNVIDGPRTNPSRYTSNREGIDMNMWQYCTPFRAILLVGIFALTFMNTATSESLVRKSNNDVWIDWRLIKNWSVNDVQSVFSPK